MENFNLEAEKNILSCLIDNKKLLYKETIREDDFSFDSNKKIFKAIKEVEGDFVDLNILRHNIKNIKKIGGMTYITNIMCNFVSDIDYSANLKLLKELRIRRELHKANLKNFNLVSDENKSVEDLMAETQKNIMEVEIEKKEETDGANLVEEIIKEQEKFYKKMQKGDKYIGIPTGLKELDNATDGLREGHVWIIGAWASTGKSSFLLNIVHNVMNKNKITLFSLEMSKMDIGSKLISIRSGVETREVIRENSSENNKMIKRIEEGKSYIYNSNLNLYTKYFKLEDIKMIIKKDFYEKGTEIFAIDYAQNILGDGMREYDLLSKTAIDLQGIARELGVTIILLSQVSNESAKGGGAGAGFKGTGAFEAVADVAIRLSRDKKTENVDSPSVPLKVNLFKNRHGFVGVINKYSLDLKSGKLVDMYNSDNINF